LRKKALGIILIAGILLLLPAVVSAEAIGYVDFEFLFYAHPEYDLKNQQLQEKAEELYVRIQEEAEQLETEEEINELGAYYEYQFELIEQEVRLELVAFILQVIEEVAVELGISAVLPEGSIIYGGLNITEQVVEAMYKHYGISVPSSIRELL
jgi:outer membrane protein